MVRFPYILRLQQKLTNYTQIKYLDVSLFMHVFILAG